MAKRIFIEQNKNWRDNCRHCPYFEECRSEKSAEECKSFLDNIAMNNLLKFAAKLRQNK